MEGLYCIKELTPPQPPKKCSFGMVKSTFENICKGFSPVKDTHNMLMLINVNHFWIIRIEYPFRESIDGGEILNDSCVCLMVVKEEKTQRHNRGLKESQEAAIKVIPTLSFSVKEMSDHIRIQTHSRYTELCFLKRKLGSICEHSPSWMNTT